MGWERERATQRSPGFAGASLRLLLEVRNTCVTFLRVDVVAALADPVRRDILVMLRRGPLPAGAIAEAFPISRPAVSRHLRVLREHGLIVEESAAKDGRERLYRLETAPLGEIEAWLAQFRNDWPAMLDALETEVQRTRRERRGTISKSKPGNEPTTRARNTA